MTIIGLIVFLVLIGLAFWVIRTLGAVFTIPAPIITVLQVVLVVFVVLYLLQMLGMISGMPLRLR